MVDVGLLQDMAWGPTLRTEPVVSLRSLAAAAGAIVGREDYICDETAVISVGV
jgi:hypothetical protein